MTKYHSEWMPGDECPVDVPDEYGKMPEKEFRFPAPGELRNNSWLPVEQPDLYRLLVASAPMLVAAGKETDEYDDAYNSHLLTWWNIMNSLDRELARRCQSVITEMCSQLPDAPWEEVE